MNEDSGTTVEQTAPKRGPGRPPKVEQPRDDIVAVSAASTVLKVEEMPEPEPQCQADKENHKLIGELRETLEPFAKLPCEPNEPLEKVLYKITRGLGTVEITNGNIIRAKKALGMM